MAASPNPKQVPRAFGATPSEVVGWLSDTFTYAIAWGTEDFAKRPAQLQAEFRDMVAKLDLHATARKQAMLALQLGAPLTDFVLDSLMDLVRIDGPQALPETVRNQFTRVVQVLDCTRLRLEAEECVFVSADYPEPILSGRWAKPIRMT